MSRKKAIDNFCKGCIYDGYEHGTWRAQVEACTMLSCELYTYRPLTRDTTKTNAKSTQKQTQELS